MGLHLDDFLDLLNEDDVYDEILTASKDESDLKSVMSDDNSISLIDELSNSSVSDPQISSTSLIPSTPSTRPTVTIEGIGNWKGFKLIGDNIDKNIHRSFQRLNYTTMSLHYFHSYALLDRVDFSGLSDDPPNGVIDFTTLLPDSNDIETIKETFIILVTR